MLSLPLLSCNFSKRLLLLYEKREKSTPFDSKGVSHWIGGKRTRDIRSSMKRGIELFLFFTIFFFSLWKWFERTNSSRDVGRRLHLSQARTLEVWSKCSGKMEEFFPKGREKGFLRDARGDEIYMEEFWKNISFSRGREREGHLSCSFRVETLGGGEEVVFGEKLKGVLVNNAINICEH